MDGEVKVIWKKGYQNAKQVWDDRALIKAYDLACAKIKDKLSPQKVENAKDTPCSKQSSSKKSKISGTSTSSLSRDQWKKGHFCRALNPDDGNFYEARIKHLDKPNHCVSVYFIGYGTKVKISLDKLAQSHGHQARKEQYMKAKSNINVDVNINLSSENKPASINNQSESLNKQSISSKIKLPLFAPNDSNHANYPFASYFPTECLPKERETINIPPPLMHPPPPPFPIKENDIFSCLLMSWYMSGYHMGYYQGLKKQNTENNSSKK